MIELAAQARDEVVEKIAMELARLDGFGNQGRAHLTREHHPGTTYQQKQTELSWPEKDENSEWSHDGNYGTIHGRAYYRERARDLIVGLDLIGFPIAPAEGS